MLLTKPTAAGAKEGAIFGANTGNMYLLDIVQYYEYVVACLVILQQNPESFN